MGKTMITFTRRTVISAAFAAAAMIAAPTSFAQAAPEKQMSPSPSAVKAFITIFP